MFGTFDEAYHWLMHDLVSLGMESLRLIIPANDKTKVVYVSGGFARNEIFVRLLAHWLPDKKVYTSEVDNATALGAAMVIWESAFGGGLPVSDLGLKKVTSDVSR
jgi:sugar (pentulose or hexulose) kinase